MYACLYMQRYFESGEAEMLGRKCDLRDGSDLLPLVVRLHNIVSANWKIEVTYSGFRMHSTFGPRELFALKRDSWAKRGEEYVEQNCKGHRISIQASIIRFSVIHFPF